MVAAHREEADARVVERLGGGGARDDAGVIAVVRQVADLNDELHAVVDELLVDLVDDRDRNAVWILSGRIGGERPLRVGHDAESPGRRECRCGSYEHSKDQNERKHFFKA